MNKNSLLSSPALAVLTSGASAAQMSEPVVLPTYVVSAPRYQPAELAVNASLSELRQQAQAPLCVPVELPALKTLLARPATMAQAAKDAQTGRLAKS